MYIDGLQCSKRSHLHDTPGTAGQTGAAGSVLFL